MATKIALFNHKGGVSKTTTTFNLGWMLAEQGKKVMLVDADPQCNLTGLILGYKYVELEDFYEKGHDNNLRDGLAPAFESMPKLIGAVDCIKVDGRDGLFLLPGHIRLAEYDVTLGIAQELTGSIQTLKNLPGSINYLLNKTAVKYGIDYILIDMSPSLSSINQNLLMISNYFLVPTNPDYYSVMAIDSLTTILKKWNAWSKEAQKMYILKEAEYPFPEITPKFLGTVIQKYRLRGGKPSKGFQHWVDEINDMVKKRLVPELTTQKMILSEESYRTNGIASDYCLATIPDFNTLIATSQDAQTPVFSLTREQIEHVGIVLDKSLESVESFHDIFDELAKKIDGLINYEDGN
ncbi:MAG: AAA family ATPase [Methanomicrobia archaeon]|nr:AAA family ATPase [Methanomicrobia archaeon]